METFEVQYTLNGRVRRFTYRFDAEEIDLQHTDLRRVPAELARCTRLRRLDLSWNRIERLEHLPEGLERLCIYNNRLRDLRGLPRSLTFLEAVRNNIQRLEHLPAGLKVLYIGSNPIPRLENLPAGLAELYISNVPLPRLENLPAGLQVLSMMNCGLTNLEGLPRGLLHLELRFNPIPNFRQEELPPYLKFFQVSTRDPQLKEFLEYINRGHWAAAQHERDRKREQDRRETILSLLSCCPLVQAAARPTCGFGAPLQ